MVWGALAGAPLGRAQDGDRTPHLCVDIGGHTAPVQALAFTPDSAFLCSGGLDKAVRVWPVPPLTPAPDNDRFRSAVREDAWNEVTILRWEVGRGLRGNIHALAASPTTRKLVVGGYGARGATGDLAWFNSETGELLHARYEHRHPITGLAWSPDGRWLVSLDRSGKSLAWREDREQPQVVTRSDAELHGDDVARAIAGQIRFRPLALIKNRSALTPHYVGPSADGVPLWKLQQSRIETGEVEGTFDPAHYHSILAVAVSHDGTRAASSDGAKRLLLWDLTQPNPIAELLDESRPAISLAFSPDGRTLVAGTALLEGVAGTELQIWDVATKQLRRKRSLVEPVYACAVSPDGKAIGYVGGAGHDVLVESLSNPEKRFEFEGGSQIAAVAAPRDAGGYAVAFRGDARGNGAPRVRRFDPGTLEMADSEERLVESPGPVGEWTAEPDFENNRIALFRRRQPLAHLQLDRATHGLLACFRLLPNERGEAAALAVGTNIQHGVFVFSLTDRGAGPLLRYFRGHHDMVRSLAVSADGKYLVSGARDGMFAYWRLHGIHDPSTVSRRWGAALSVRDGRVTVSSIDDLGPLYQKGVRAGDSIDAILWVAKGQTREQRAPASIVRELEGLPWDQQVAFVTQRDGAARPPFNLFGAWYPLLTLYATERDWIAWTSSGYYACSPGGERLIGWQINNQLGQAPSFYTAERFSKTLYRPDVVQAILKAGSLTRALALRDERATEIAEIRPPRVQIVTPQRRRVEVQGRRVDVTAIARAESATPLESLTLLLNGRPFQRKTAAEATSIRAGNRELQASWSLDLTPGEHRVSVRADDTQTHGADEIVVRCTARSESQAVLRVLAIGISAYPGDLRLEFGRSDAETFAETLREQAKELFHKVEVRTLADDQATKAGIAQGLDWLSENTRWPDVAVLYFSGHGVNDAAGKFYLFPRDGELKDLPATAVAEEDIKAFCANTPGKILVLLDACHSGGIQVNVNDLARELGRNEYGVIVMSSSRGDEVARENRLWGGGAFTKALVDGLNGAADARKKGYVLTPIDLDPYVYYTVLELTQSRQTPISNKTSVAPFAITRSRR